MSPANSPNDTRPSTPPSNPYLRQIEEAIATPVPDFASTLNATPPRSTVQEEQWDAQTQIRDNDPTGSRLQPANEELIERRTYLTEEEFQHWSAENRARVTMQRQRSRTRTNMSAAVQRELNRRINATSGDGPQRESIYDWAVTGAPPRIGADALSSDDSEGESEAISTAAPNADPGARRDLQRLERALQSYRSARNALRSTRTGSSDMGAVPTASALRAYWNEDDDETPTRLYRSGALLDRYRREPVPTHAQNARTSTEPRVSTTTGPRKSDAFMRVRKLIRYLSELRDTGIEGGLDAARSLGLDTLYAPDDSNTPSDLPMHINSLPVPQYSSWLEPGMTWNGLQSTEREPPRSSVLSSSLRRERQRELFRRTLARRREMSRGISGDDFSQPPTDTLLDAERYLSDLLQDSNGRWSFSNRSTTSLSSHPTRAAPPTEADRWPVKVTISSVDWQTMTLTGTMSASHMPDKLSAVHQATEPTATSSMSSFFTGEIIDFRRQPIETEKEDRDYEVGGLDVDARYWQRLGPFKTEIDRVRYLRGKKRSEYQQQSPLWDAFRKAAGHDTENKDPHNSTSSSSLSTESGARPVQEKVFESEDDKEMEGDEIMARCLGSAKWLDEEIGKQWILMRWKERCFVTPSGNSTNSDTTRTILTAGRPPTSGPSTRRGGSNGAASWGLTISGFYYVALNRMTGEIDGLYYDPGSQPYQALKMTPEGMARPGGNGDPRVCGCGEQNCRDPVGAKKWFPSIEFR